MELSAESAQETPILYRSRRNWPFPPFLILDEKSIYIEKYTL
jgi:hypothetical protein